MQEQTILEDIIGSQNGLSTNKVLDKILLMCYVSHSLSAMCRKSKDDVIFH